MAAKPRAGGRGRGKRSNARSIEEEKRRHFGGVSSDRIGWPGVPARVDLGLWVPGCVKTSGFVSRAAGDRGEGLELAVGVERQEVA